jgi:hypothetical protein
MRIYCIAISSVCGLLLSSAAMAVTLQPLQGDVLINRGAGFERVTKPTLAAVGNSVMVAPGGSAQVAYDAQCTVAVKPGSVVTVALKPPCGQTSSFDEGAQMNLGATCGDKHFCAPPVEERPWLGLVPAAAIAVTAGLCAGGVICDHGASRD